jgi:hypothetical protein
MSQKIHAESDRTAINAAPPPTAAQTIPNRETVFGFNPRRSMLREKNCAQAVLRDFNGRRAEGSLLMKVEQTTGLPDVNPPAGIVRK